MGFQQPTLHPVVGGLVCVRLVGKLQRVAFDTVHNLDGEASNLACGQPAITVGGVCHCGVPAIRHTSHWIAFTISVSIVAATSIIPGDSNRIAVIDGAPVPMH